MNTTNMRQPLRREDLTETELEFLRNYSKINHRIRDYLSSAAKLACNSCCEIEQKVNTDWWLKRLEDVAKPYNGGNA